MHAYHISCLKAVKPKPKTFVLKLLPVLMHLTKAKCLKSVLQDNSGEIENEELSGFLKDLLELVKNVSCVNIK